MSLEPNEKTKYVLEDFPNETTFWFETVEECAEYLTENRMIDTEDFACYELGKEIKFKIVAVPSIADKETKEPTK